MRLAIYMLFVLFSAASMGCNSGPDNNAVMEVKDFDPIAEIKKGLEGIKSTGRIGSNFGSMRGHLVDIRKKDAAKADELDKLLQELTALTDSAKIKAKAAEILGKL